MFKKTLDYGGAGDNVGCLLRTVKRDDVQRGQVLAAPGSVKTYKEFEAELYVLTQEEGKERLFPPRLWLYVGLAHFFPPAGPSPFPDIFVPTLPLRAYPCLPYFLPSSLPPSLPFSLLLT